MFAVTEVYIANGNEVEINYVKTFPCHDEATDFLKKKAEDLYAYEKEEEDNLRGFAISEDETDLCFEIDEKREYAHLSKYDGQIQWFWQVTKIGEAN